MTLKSQQPPTAATNNRSAAQAISLPTFLEHIHELRRRLFWVVGFVLLASAAAFPLQQHVMNLLTAPLGSERLYYITPVGGFSFLIKVCTYVGILVAIPLIIYHLYRFLEPLMQHIKKSVLFYVIASSFLAMCGILFAYFVSLPAALHFLTNINIGQVQAMLTVDSYLTFVMTYLLGAALLFQIPLVLMIINGITPLPPKRLMGFQRYVLLGAFIVAAIISPTPDVVNQAFLAVPIIVMYQVGIVSVWTQQRRQKTANVLPAVEQVEAPQPMRQPAVVTVKPVSPVAPVAAQRRVVRSLDGFTVASAVQPQARPVTQSPRSISTSARPTIQPRYISVPPRSVDGIVARRTPYTPTA